MKAPDPAALVLGAGLGVLLVTILLVLAVRVVDWSDAKFDGPAVVESPQPVPPACGIMCLQMRYPWFDEDYDESEDTDSLGPVRADLLVGR
jgi:hypothetical protein